MRILSTRFFKLLSLSLSYSMTIHHHHHKDLIIVIMGATGTGKMKLSLDIAVWFGSKIVNSVKIQVYFGLDIITNKVLIPDRHEMPYHIQGFIDPSTDELTTSSFYSLTDSAINSEMDATGY